MHTKFLLLCKPDKNGRIKRYKARLVSHRNEEYDFEKDSFSPAAASTTTKLLMYLALQ